MERCRHIALKMFSIITTLVLFFAFNQLKILAPEAVAQFVPIHLCCCPVNAACKLCNFNIRHYLLFSIQNGRTVTEKRAGIKHFVHIVGQIGIKFFSNQFRSSHRTYILFYWFQFIAFYFYSFQYQQHIVYTLVVHRVLLLINSKYVLFQIKTGYK